MQCSWNDNVSTQLAFRQRLYRIWQSRLPARACTASATAQDEHDIQVAAVEAELGRGVVGEVVAGDLF